MKVESITIGNEYWNYNLETGGFIGKGTLSGILRYAEGPCTATALNSGICRFDTRTGYTTTTGIRLESITVGNQFWNFEVDTGNLYTEGLLSAQSRYTTSGLCSTSQPSNCNFDSRATYRTTTTDGVEIITARGKIWYFDADTFTVLANPPAPNGTDLTSSLLPYRNGPCQDMLLGTCRFDTQEVVIRADGVLRDTITESNIPPPPPTSALSLR